MTRGRFVGNGQRQAYFVAENDAQEEEAEEAGDQYCGLFSIGKVQNTPDSGIQLELKANGVKMSMELDTGASVSIVSKETWQKELSKVKLQKSDVLLKTYTDEPLPIIGEAEVTVEYKTQKVILPLIVVGGKGPSLFGRNWLKSIKLDWKQVKSVSTELEALLKKHSTLFKEELGTVKGLKAKLAVSPDAIPKFCRARPVPYAIKEAIENDLARLERQNIVEKVD